MAHSTACRPNPRPFQCVAVARACSHRTVAPSASWRRSSSIPWTPAAPLIARPLYRGPPHAYGPRPTPSRLAHIAAPPSTGIQVPPRTRVSLFPCNEFFAALHHGGALPQRGGHAWRQWCDSQPCSPGSCQTSTRRWLGAVPRWRVLTRRALRNHLTKLEDVPIVVIDRELAHAVRKVFQRIADSCRGL